MDDLPTGMMEEVIYYMKARVEVLIGLVYKICEGESAVDSIHIRQ